MSFTQDELVRWKNTPSEDTPIYVAGVFLLNQAVERPEMPLATLIMAEKRQES
jgi:hypothetical protein